MPTSRSADRKSTRLNSSHTEIYTLSLHDALPIYPAPYSILSGHSLGGLMTIYCLVHHPEMFNAYIAISRSEEHTSELQSHRDLHSFPTRRSSDLPGTL